VPEDLKIFHCEIFTCIVFSPFVYSSTKPLVNTAVYVTYLSSQIYQLPASSFAYIILAMFLAE